MNLSSPIDFQILKVLADNGHNVVPNLALIIGESNTDIDDRLQILSNYKLVNKVGPADYSGLYEITPRGKVALELQDKYNNVKNFDVLIDESLLDRVIQTDCSLTSCVDNADEKPKNA